jgi:hypothetical protein
MVLIYALVSGEEVLYVGQTIQTLQERASGHKKVSNTCGSKNIPPDIQWEIKLLEECAENAAARERHYIETLTPPYNERIPGRTKSEYAQMYKHTEICMAYEQSETRKEAKRAYHHTEAAKATKREYRQTEDAKALHRDGERRRRLKKKAEREATRL